MDYLGKLLFYLLWPAAFIYTRLFRAPRVRVIIESADGEWLLVKSWFGRQRWAFAGGGVGRGETLKAAAVREVYEETGIQLYETQLEDLGDERIDDGVRLRVQVFRAIAVKNELPALSKLRSFEIIDRRWFKIDELPENISSLVTQQSKS